MANKAFVIRRVEQVEVLASPLRARMVATMEHLGTCSVRELAEQLGRWRRS